MRKWSCIPLQRGWMIGMLWAVILGAMPVLAQAPWAMSGCGANHNGQSTVSGAMTPTVKWVYNTDDVVNNGLTPVVGCNGTVYAVGYNGGPSTLNAISANGTCAWDCELAPLSIPGKATTAAIATNGTIYVAYDKLYAIAADGTPKWTVTGPCGAGTPVVDTSVVYFASGGALVAVNANGTKKWTKTVGTVITTPALGLNGLIAVGSANKLLAIDTAGTVRGTYTAPCTVSAPVIGADGTIYFTAGTTLYAISGLGSFKWSKNLCAPVSPPAVAADGTVYCGVGTNTIYALSSTGSVKWTTKTATVCSYTAPAVAANGAIYIAANAANYARIYALGPCGTVLWDYVSSYTSGMQYSAPVVGANNTVLVKAFPKAASNGTGSVIALQTAPACVWQPDLGLFNEPTATYLGNNIYNTSGAGQCVTTSCGTGLTRTFQIPLQNDSPYATNYRLIASAGTSKWQVRYYTPSGTNGPIDITAEITGLGWTTPTIGAAATLPIYAEVKPLIAAAGTICVKVGAESYALTKAYDLVSMTVTAPSVCTQPDVVLSASPSSTDYCGNNVINTDGYNQTMTATLAPGTEKWYFVRIQNDGNTATKFYIGTPAVANGNFAYKIINAAGTDLSACMRAAPYYCTATVAPRGEVLLTVVIRTACTAPAGQTFSVPLRVWSVTDTAARDCAVVRATVNGCAGAPADESAATPDATVSME